MLHLEFFFVFVVLSIGDVSLIVSSGGWWDDRCGAATCYKLMAQLLNY